MPIPFKGTKEEFDMLPSDRTYYCPNCGLAITTPCGGCGCPQKRTKNGFWFVDHINK